MLRSSKYHPTKYCELTVFLNTGIRVAGKFHVPISQSTVIRPFDAVRDAEGGFLILSDATIYEANAERHRAAIMIAHHSISHIEHADEGWKSVGDRPNVPTETFSATLSSGSPRKETAASTPKDP